MVQLTFSALYGTANMGWVHHYEQRAKFIRLNIGFWRH